MFLHGIIKQDIDMEQPMRKENKTWCERYNGPYLDLTSQMV